MTPSPQHLKEAREILNRACVSGTSDRYPDLASDLAQALSLSESRGVKKERERCAKIVETPMFGDTATEEIHKKVDNWLVLRAKAIRTQAESDPPTPVDEGNEGIAQIGFDASRGLISGNLAKSKLLEALSAKDEIIKELREKLSNS